MKVTGGCGGRTTVTSSSSTRPPAGHRLLHVVASARTRVPVYVGQTALAPSERFDQHRSGIGASRWVRKYGLHFKAASVSMSASFRLRQPRLNRGGLGRSFENAVTACMGRTRRDRHSVRVPASVSNGTRRETAPADLPRRSCPAMSAAERTRATPSWSSALAALLDAVPPGAPTAEYERRGARGQRARQAHRRCAPADLPIPEGALPASTRLAAVPSAPRPLGRRSGGRPLLAGLVRPRSRLRSSGRAATAIIAIRTRRRRSPRGDLAEAVGEHFPGSYGESTLAKIGRNTFSSWEQTGHLAAASRRTTKVRTRATCRPANVAYALLLGHSRASRGQALFETLWAKVLDQPTSHLFDLAVGASQRGTARVPPRRRRGRGRLPRAAPPVRQERARL